LGGRRVLCAPPRDRRAGLAIARKLATCVAASAFSIAALMLVVVTASAQDSSRAILGPGNAVVTGFSGVRAPAPPLPPRVDPVERTFIDLDRPSARVIQLDALLGPPAGQLVAAPKPFSVTAAQVGQVFSIALDDATPPNIFLSASSAYGLPIVVPDRDGDGRPDRSRRGAPNANFMPGLFGPVTVNGGPGSIWKIDGRSGVVALFANVMLDSAPNSGPALGGLAFDPGSRQLFVADRDTGMIHRFGLDGADRGRFDHGTDGLRAAGLPAVPFDPRKRLDLTSPAFDSGNTETWAYAPLQRRVFALAVRSGRLFYAVAANLQIWSVSIAPNGGFGPDPRLELNVPPAQSGAEISNIVFDDRGYMILAERGAPSGAYDYVTLTSLGENRVLRFRPKRPEDPPSPGFWHPAPEEYAVGFPPNFRNNNGGLAIGYGYGANGGINRAVCGDTLWSTGEQLRNARDPAAVARLQSGGPLIVNGLQGNAVDLVRPQNAPPLQSYFIDYDDRFDDPAARGHLGDVEIWRICARAAAATPLPPPTPVAPALVCAPGWFNVGGECVTGQACPAGTAFEDGCCVYRDCPPSYVKINDRCVPPPMLCRSDETYADGRCVTAMCPPGLVVTPPKNGTNGATNGLRRTAHELKKSSATNGLAKNGIGPPPTNGIGISCPDGKTAVNGQCPPAGDGGKKMCAGYCGCPAGSKADGNGNCVRTPPIVDECPRGTVQVCRGEAPNLTCSCATPPPVTDDCTRVDQLRGLCVPPPPPLSRCPEGTSLVCNERDRCSCQPPGATPPPTTITCPPDTVKVCRGDSPDETKDCGCTPITPPPPPPAECAFPNVVVDGVCCKYGDYQAGTCGGKPPAAPPTRIDCSIRDLLRGTCGPSRKPPPVTADCTKQRQLRGECLPAPPSSQPPTDPPGAQLGYCPSLFRMVGATCCNMFTAGSCFPNSPGVACPSDYTVVGEGFSAQCCRQSAVKCTTRSANASCASGEIPVQDGSVSACCREDPAGSCVPPSTPTPNIDVSTPPSKKCGGWVWVPIIGFICEIWDTRDHNARICYADNDCPVGTACRDGSCVEQGVSQPNAVPASAACQPPSVPVSGNCCTAESVAAGTCSAPPPVCLDGKVFQNNACRCPTGTVENTKSGKCETPKPAAVQKPKPIPTKPKELVCQKGFHVENGRCVADAPPKAIPGFDIQIGIGIGGGGRSGGGRPGGGGGGSPKPPPTPR
jgi:hypothetical protein